MEKIESKSFYYELLMGSNLGSGFWPSILFAKCMLVIYNNCFQTLNDISKFLDIQVSS